MNSERTLTNKSQRHMVCLEQNFITVGVYKSSLDGQFLVFFLENELASCMRSVFRLVYELVLSEFGVEGSVLERTEFEGELRTHLLEASLGGRIKNVAMLSEENVVTLVVDGENASTVEVRSVGEERAE